MGLKEFNLILLQEIKCTMSMYNFTIKSYHLQYSFDFSYIIVSKTQINHQV